MDRVEAIKILKSRHDISLPFEREALETLIPELNESRDEQIRKAIIKSLDMPFPEDNLPGTDVTYKEAVSYLDHLRDDTKMVEQKPADEQFPPLEGLDAIKAKYYDKGLKNGFDEGVAGMGNEYGGKIYPHSK